MMKSPFLDEELLSAEPRPDFDTAVERVAKESPFLEGFAEASLNRASSEDQYYVNEFPPEDAQESLKSATRKAVMLNMTYPQMHRRSTRSRPLSSKRCGSLAHSRPAGLAASAGSPATSTGKAFHLG